MAGNQGNYRKNHHNMHNERKNTKTQWTAETKGKKAAGQKAITYVRMRRNVAAATIRA